MADFSKSVQVRSPKLARVKSSLLQGDRGKMSQPLSVRVCLCLTLGLPYTTVQTPTQAEDTGNCLEPAAVPSNTVWRMGYKKITESWWGREDAANL